MLVEVLNKEGRKTGELELSDNVFAIEPNEHVMHLAVLSHLAAKRQGTHKAKERGEVRGGGRKPWRQKGRGTARAGSTRSPLWVGGGAIHGPRPHGYSVKLNRKLKKLAKKSALSLRASEKNIIVLEDFNLEEFKTKHMFDVVKNLQIENEKILLLLPENNDKIYFSSRNIKKLNVSPAGRISTYDILNHKKVVLFKGAIEKLEQTLAN